MNKEDVLTTGLIPHVIQISLNRPEKKNALSLKLIQELSGALKSLPKDTRILILKGEGDFFSAGLDLHDLQASDLALFSTHVADLFYALATLPCVTLASIHGGAFAGGLGLVAACDLAIASRESMFALPELKRGVLPTLVYALLKRQVPIRFLNELILTAEPITAVRAHSIGMINQVISFEETDVYLRNLTGQILKNAPETMRAYKKHLQFDKDLKHDFEDSLELHKSMQGSKEMAEGLASFMEKRQPSWLV